MEFQGTHTLRIEARDHGTRPQASQTEVTILVDDSEPVGLHNDFLLGLGPNDGLIGEGGNSLGLNLLGSDTMVIVYVIVGVVFVSLSFLITAIIFCRRLKSRQERHRRHWHYQRRHDNSNQWRGNEAKVNGFVEVNSNTREDFLKHLNGYKQSGKITILFWHWFLQTIIKTLHR